MGMNNKITIKIDDEKINENSDKIKKIVAFIKKINDEKENDTKEDEEEYNPQELFTLADTNNDGYITIEELTQLAKNVGVSDEEFEQNYDFFMIIFDKYAVEKNSVKYLDLNGFISFFTEVEEMEKEMEKENDTKEDEEEYNPQELFTLADTNNDG